MANPEHLRILRQGAGAWNARRRQHPGILQPDLREANLSRADLTGARLIMGNLSGADLFRADLSGANLSEADLSDAFVAFTLFANLDLRDVKGLESVRHRGPSTIGIDTVYRSEGNIPEAFLRGAGCPDTFIEYVRSLVAEPIQYYFSFISYCHKDEEFARCLHNDLQANGVRCWFAPEDMKIGDRIRPAIDVAIRVRDKLLVVLSESSIRSDWVETEVETAFEEERRRKKTVLFPVRLDDAVMDTDEAWAAEIRRTRHIGDFTGRTKRGAYQKAFARLLGDLREESAGEQEAE